MIRSLTSRGHPPRGRRGPGRRARFHHATLISQAAEHLAAELAERGRLPVLLTGEAHLLSHDQLEAIRMLTSAQLDSAIRWPSCSSASPTCGSA